MGSPLFEILNGVFEAVDCYWHECLPGQETAFEISEQRLRKAVNEALIYLINPRIINSFFNKRGSIVKYDYQRIE